MEREMVRNGKWNSSTPVTLSPYSLTSLDTRKLRTGDPHCYHEAFTGGNTSINIWNGMWFLILKVKFDSMETNRPLQESPMLWPKLETKIWSGSCLAQSPIVFGTRAIFKKKWRMICATLNLTGLFSFHRICVYKYSLSFQKKNYSPF